MEAEITSYNPGEHSSHPIVLGVSMKNGSMSFGFTYKLKAEGDEKAKRVEGMIQGGGGMASGTVDDADWDDYVIEAEKESVSAVLDYLKKQYPGASITGTINGEFASLYHPAPREHKLGE